MCLLCTFFPIPCTEWCARFHATTHGPTLGSFIAICEDTQGQVVSGQWLDYTHFIMHGLMSAYSARMYTICTYFRCWLYTYNQLKLSNRFHSIISNSVISVWAWHKYIYTKANDV